MEPSQAARALHDLVHRNPHCLAAWFDDPLNPRRLTIVCPENSPIPDFCLPAELSALDLDIRPGTPFQTLICPDDGLYPANIHQTCQDEPINLGTQIQPQGADWLGTAGAPVKWLDGANAPHWGILSNWHVMAAGRPALGRYQFQPTKNYPPCAALSNWSTVDPNGPNRIDAAIADALIDGWHTISSNIIGIGPIGAEPVNASLGLAVSKSGRTTGVTHGHCAAVGAAVQIGYGDFTATFVDQDIFQPQDGPFSAPGDSGSMIATAAGRFPCSLLFAGSEDLTVGNPIRFVNEALGLVHPFS